MNRTLICASLLLAALLAGGCENDGPAERAGERLDNAAENVADAVEDACEDIKEGAGADDTDC